MPGYIKKFMGPDFRSVQGPDYSFNLKDCINPDFEPLVEKREGCYVISTNGQELTYANGKKSRVLYIGLSDNLRRRLLSEHFGKHLKRLMLDKNFGLDPHVRHQMQDKYQYMLYLGAHVDVFYTRGTQDIKNFESLLIYRFYEHYRSMPVGNGARSFER